MRGFITPKGYGPLAAEYASFLLEKIGFHNKHPDVEGDLALDKYQKVAASKPFDHNYALQLATHLLDLQDAILKMQASVFAAKEKSELKFACLIPLVLESFAAYRLSTWLLKKVVDGLDSVDVFSFLTEKFYSQFISLRSFYFEASNVRYVSSVIAVPTLPQDPPKFTYTPPKKQLNNQSNKNNNANFNNAPRGFEVSSDMGQGFGWGQGQGQQPGGAFDPFGSNPNDPFNSAFQNQNQNQRPMFDQFGNPIQYDQFGNPIPVGGQQGSQYGDQYIDPHKRSQFGVGGAGDMFDPTQDPDYQYKLQQQQLQQNQFGQGQGGQGGQSGQGGQGQGGQGGQGGLGSQGGQGVGGLGAAGSQTGLGAGQQALTPQVQSVQPQTSPQKIQISKATTGDASSSDMASLQRRLKELEERLNKESQDRLALQKEIAMLRHENASLKFRIQDMTRQRENDLRAARVRALNEQLDHLEKISSNLEDPNNLGNEFATPDDLSTAAEAVLSNFEKVEQSAGKTQEELLTSAALLISSLGTLMANAKGAARNSNSASLKQELYDNLRNTNAATESLFQILKSSPQNKAMVADALSIGRVNVPNVQKIALKIKEDENKKIEDIEQEDSLHLEELAHQELLSAARVIEEAAQSLLKAKSAPKPAKVVLTETQMKVADSIVEAAMGIARATANLVNHASAAQMERVSKGLQGDNSKAYKPDRTWSEGLISAAKLVANATSQLIEVAHKAVLGELDEATLVAASKQVGAATQQLVAACRSKSDPGSQSLQNLEISSKAVSTATQHLVDAAKAAGGSDQEEIVIKTSTNVALSKAQELEQQAVIYRLEQALEQARKKLFKIRQSAYAGSTTPVTESSTLTSTTPEAANQKQ
eukprot:TRINITY_DN397_c0_g1_i4.p1 TRINITY_DN397_c0_g1~~TRINITY_DN397_c0_g1_i4.p1  ORF type:complete len:998 (-),score=335.19 TRINITY_DN397_c0_g1_i4:91-2712(-)